MTITDEMLLAAFQEGVRAGIFPRQCNPLEREIHKEVLRALLSAALNANYAINSPTLKNVAAGATASLFENIDESTMTDKDSASAKK